MNFLVVVCCMLTTILVGQYPYRSDMSERKESLPICMSILGARGRDVELPHLAQSFLESKLNNWRTSVATGSEAFLRSSA